MIRLEQENEYYTVWQDDLRHGTVSLYDNPGHMGNRYVKLALDRYDTAISAELFRLLREIAGRPLQAMVSSENVEQVQFLIAGGFVSKRKCYEVEASAEDYVGEQSDVPLSKTKRGEAAYDRCCEILFNHYVETHRAVNPWTAGYKVFLEELPETVSYQELDGRITALAFVEENEIAYVCGVGKTGFTDFAASMITEMFERHETIFFESDDCDWPAMAMKSLFANQDETSFDTYVYKGSRMKLTKEKVQKDLDALPERYKIGDVDKLIRQYVKEKADVSALRPYILTEQQFHRIYYYVSLNQIKDIERRMAFIHENLLFSDWWHTDQIISYVADLDFDTALRYAKDYIYSEDPFIRRWGYVMFISRLCKGHAVELLPLMHDDDHYYVQMAQGWLIAELAVHEPKAVYEWFQKNDLKYIINGKAIQKICDSFRNSDEWKTEFKKLRPALRGRK